MNAAPQALGAQALDFRSTAADLALQLQQASRSAVLLADDLARAERVVNILIKYMPPAQMVHARLEIEEAAADAHAAKAAMQARAEPVARFDGYDGDTCEPVVRVLNREALRAGMQLYAIPFAETEAPSIPVAVRDVLAERRRQVEEEGWTPDYDDVQEGGELAEAAMCYAAPVAHCQLGIPHHWPWVADSWKPRDRRRNLVRAGALIIAEIERLDRAGRQEV